MPTPSAQADDEELNIDVVATMVSVFGPYRLAYDAVAGTVAALRAKLVARDNENARLRQEVVARRSELAGLTAHRIEYINTIG